MISLDDLPIVTLIGLIGLFIGIYLGRIMPREQKEVFKND